MWDSKMHEKVGYDYSVCILTIHKLHISYWKTFNAVIIILCFVDFYNLQPDKTLKQNCIKIKETSTAVSSHSAPWCSRWTNIKTSETWYNIKHSKQNNINIFEILTLINPNHRRPRLITNTYYIKKRHSAVYIKRLTSYLNKLRTELKAESLT